MDSIFVVLSFSIPVSKVSPIFFVAKIKVTTFFRMEPEKFFFIFCNFYLEIIINRHLSSFNFHHLTTFLYWVLIFKNNTDFFYWRYFSHDSAFIFQENENSDCEKYNKKIWWMHKCIYLMVNLIDCPGCYWSFSTFHWTDNNSIRKKTDQNLW